MSVVTPNVSIASGDTVFEKVGGVQMCVGHAGSSWCRASCPSWGNQLRVSIVSGLGKDISLFSV